MLYELKNEALQVTVSSAGAELWSLRTAGEHPVECLWDARPEVWPWHAPVCFPWCGALEEGWSHNCRPVSPGRHGLVRSREHTLVEHTPHRLHLRLRYEGREWPWPFTFDTVHTLSGNTLTTTCTAINDSSEPMPVQLGFHTGLRCPLDPDRRPQDYLLRFQCPEAPGGGDVLPLSPALFTGDTICLSGLSSRWLQLEENGTGRALRMEVSGYPYVLLWSQPGLPGFLCIEPWSGYIGLGRDLVDRPGTLLLSSGQTFSRSQHLTVLL